MIRLFAADLDGTLLNSMHMTDRTILTSIGKVRAAGAHFSVATGRVFRTTRDFGFCGGMCVVCANGSIVLGEGDEVLRAEAVDPAFCVDLVSEFGDLPFEFVTAEHNYHRCSEAEHAAAFADAPRYWRIATRGMRMTGGPEYVYDCTSAQLASLPVCKVNLHLQGQVPEVAREVSAFLAEHPEVVNAPFDPTMFEITAAGVDKGSALAWLAGWLGLGEDEVAVYGDGGNDICMLERFAAFGHAYATSNGSADAKRAAGNVIGSCARHAVPRHMLETLRREGSDAAR